MTTLTKTFVMLMLLCGVLQAADRRNVVFIITDQQFAEVMSCRMGRQYLHTPAMDSLAERGLCFRRAYSSNPLCMPWRNSVFSGRFPHETGVTSNSPAKGVMDPKTFVCMGVHFRNAGYDAAYSGKWHLCYNAKDIRSHGFEMLTGKAGEDPDVHAADAAIGFLERPHDKPFLLVASFVNPHNVCEWSRRLSGRNQRLNCGEIGDPPPPDQLPPAPANLAPPEDEPDGMTLMRRAYQVEDGLFPVAKFTNADWRKLRWGYYRMVELADRQIGRVLDSLRRTGLDKNTLIVFTADHGECAGAHRFNQKTVLYEESVRVPLVLDCPGATAGGATDALVNTGVDILPTMLDFAGLDIPKVLPGRSLLPWVLGKPVTDWREYVVVEKDMAQAGELDGRKPRMEGRAVCTAQYKYCIFSRGERRESLTDLQADPGELKNLARDPKCRKVLLEHRALLAAFAKEHQYTLSVELLADDVKPIPFPTK